MWALCIAVTAAGLINVYGDNAEVIALAETAACGAPECSVQLTQMSRNPIEQAFTFQTSKKDQTVARVSCRRAFWLVGEYSCALAP